MRDFAAFVSSSSTDEPFRVSPSLASVDPGGMRRRSGTGL
jgi:hypothetical protein